MSGSTCGARYETISISVTPEKKRSLVRDWLDAALESVDPRRLVREALAGSRAPSRFIAIGKAAVPMSWGAVDALGPLPGVCIAGNPAETPSGVELIVGNHPIPGDQSFEAGRRALEWVSKSDGPILALISGGGSSLCEAALPGIEESYLLEANKLLLYSGAPISEVNLIRQHLSAIKCGGLARAAGGQVETLVLSDVCGGASHLVASGPTIHGELDPETALQLMKKYGLPSTEQVRSAIHHPSSGVIRNGPVQVLADGRTAGTAVVDAARNSGVDSRLEDGWLIGGLERRLDSFLGNASEGATVAVGEPTLEVIGNGEGGRNTHAAALAARSIAGTNTVFAAFATDGVDGCSNSAGGLVDGQTTSRGGDADQAIRSFDTAKYLDRANDLIHTGPTGTNVSDLWVSWKD